MKAILAISLASETSRFLKENPGQYNFALALIPKSEDGKGCILGWMGYFAEQRNMQLPWGSCGAIADVIGISTQHFYNQLCNIQKTYQIGDMDWQDDAIVAAECLDKWIEQLRSKV